MANGRGFGVSAVLVLFLVNIAMFLVQVSVEGFTESFLLVSEDVSSRPWILITSMFLHGSPAHLFFNMYALIIFGGLIEQRIGTKRFLTLYFTSGLLAGIAATLFYPAALGASGAVMGVIGISILLLPDLRILLFFFIPMSMRTAGIIFAMIDVLGLLGVPVFGGGIAHAAHLAGLACGLGYGYYLMGKRKSARERVVGRRRPPRRRTNSDYQETIELTEEDIENYLRDGRL